MTALVSPVSQFLHTISGYEFVPCIAASTTECIMTFRYVLSVSLNDLPKKENSELKLGCVVSSPVSHPFFAYSNSGHM